MDLGYCCLCQSSLPADRRRRRRLHGPSCGSLMQRLQSIAEVPLENLQETADTNASLCSSCEGQIKSIDAQEMKITDIKAKITNVTSMIRRKLSTLHRIPVLGKRQQPLSESLPQEKIHCTRGQTSASQELPVQSQQTTAITESPHVQVSK